MELEQAMTRKSSALASGECLQSDNSDVLQAVSVIRKNYTTKLEQSEKQKPARARKRSNDRNRLSKRLTEEAEKYLEDFISNVEDTDISSFDGERSDGSSTLGVITKPRDAAAHCAETETFQCPATSNSLPTEIDGVILPWLQWETSNDGSLPCKNKIQPPVTPKTISWDAAQEVISAQDPSGHSTSSGGSWNPRLLDGPSMNTGEDTTIISKDLGRHQKSQFDMDRVNTILLFSHHCSMVKYWLPWNGSQACVTAFANNRLSLSKLGRDQFRRLRNIWFDYPIVKISLLSQGCSLGESNNRDEEDLSADVLSEIFLARGQLNTIRLHPTKCTILHHNPTQKLQTITNWKTHDLIQFRL
ncbi:hypothetical protein F0562_024370 [Nyssa sinensis]|uniref:Uncharacterized protein n=1 Tax=Nyssa sinensis TaxID=561372 RepID=A0A5J5BHX4_9ASTE|nr:hypothetical protein F0562_024370 [Nyssa sinensis]